MKNMGPSVCWVCMLEEFEFVTKYYLNCLKLLIPEYMSKSTGSSEESSCPDKVETRIVRHTVRHTMWVNLIFTVKIK